MPKVSRTRDDMMAVKGYLRVAIAAKLLGYSLATISRWPERENIDRISMSGMCWVNWKQLRAYVNKHKFNESGQGLADAENLPTLATVALKRVRDMAVPKGS